VSQQLEGIGVEAQPAPLNSSARSNKRSGDASRSAENADLEPDWSLLGL
jgi:hypothetical protein